MIAKAKRPVRKIPRRKALRLSITVECGASQAQLILRQLKRAHSLLDSHLEEMSIALVGDRRMSELHQQFMAIDGPTDVLTFPLELDDKGRVISGEIVICVPEARRKCRENRTTLPQELLLYALHGMLHLCGYDDRTQRDFNTMHRTEDRILTQLGIGPVFRAGPAKPAQRGRGSGRGSGRESRRGKVS